MKKYTLIGAVMTFVFVFTFTIIGSTYANTLASEGGASQLSTEEMKERRGEMKENMEAMRVAVSSGDYDTWISLVSETKHGEEILEVINESNWDQFVEAHNLIEEGRSLMQQGKEKMEELGIDRMKGKGMRGHGKRMQ